MARAGTAPKSSPPAGAAPAGVAPGAGSPPAAGSTGAPGTDRAPSRSTRSTSARSVFAGGATVDNGAGVILAALALFWVGIPFARGGVDGVRAVWRAKWTNKTVDGRWL